jgi:hypothetical protein
MNLLEQRGMISLTKITLVRVCVFCLDASFLSSLSPASSHSLLFIVGGLGFLQEFPFTTPNTWISCMKRWIWACG